MKSITDQEIQDIINSISEQNSPEISQYLDLFFSEYTDIEFFKDMTLTGREHQKLEAALIGMVKISTMSSVRTVFTLLEQMGYLVRNENK
ncbi:hypothetical protein M3936_14070 [Sutcliffiella horikoshii]|uniref:hypothetical protein n=1 Tax=Sutcliffiella horikoshii TaxID=79883 RepID=UPI0020426A3B|nr:hypothetical protein [Sutcliffiella horikoshii]MCM3618713.1 hypothetical protein [Sutcliffiella horikoshii]